MGLNLPISSADCRNINTFLFVESIVMDFFQWLLGVDSSIERCSVTCCLAATYIERCRKLKDFKLINYWCFEHRQALCCSRTRLRLQWIFRERGITKTRRIDYDIPTESTITIRRTIQNAASPVEFPLSFDERHRVCDTSENIHSKGLFVIRIDASIRASCQFSQ